MRTRQHMEEVQGEPGTSDGWCECWTLEKQEGYTVPDFVRQIETAWKKLNNINPPKNPGKGRWD